MESKIYKKKNDLNIYMLNQYVEKDPELLKLCEQEKAQAEAQAEAEAKKKQIPKAKDILIKKGVLPTKEEVIQLCIHGHIHKITQIEKSYFTKALREELITTMKAKIDDIKKWITEPENAEKVDYFRHRKSGIFKIIQYFRNMD